MDYRDALISEIESYYREVIERYKDTTQAAMKTARKMPIFKKQDYSVHLENFKGHMKDALEFTNANVQIPEDDEKAIELVQKLHKSVDSFCRLCETNIKFYKISEQKQYRNSGIKISDYKLAYGVVSEALEESVADLDDLDKAYRDYAPEKFEKN